jgi:hypothetical protein
MAIGLHNKANRQKLRMSNLRRWAGNGLDMKDTEHKNLQPITPWMDTPAQVAIE